MEEIERKMLGQIGFYKNTATLVNLRPLGKKSKIAEELQKCLHHATYAEFVNWTSILRMVFLHPLRNKIIHTTMKTFLRQLQTRIPSIQIKGKMRESNIAYKPKQTQNENVIDFVTLESIVALGRLAPESPS